MDDTSTIVAISTSKGNGAIAIVRMSGSRAFDITCLITKRDNFSPRYATLSSVYGTEGDLIDEAIVIYFKAPHSYTREDLCEIQCHGGWVSAKMILESCLHNGARLARPGEFSKRAFLNGRIDFSQVNALSKLMNVANENVAKALVRQLKGELSIFVSQIRESLMRLLAHSEVMIDYSEEDIPSDMQVHIISTLEDIRQKLSNIYEFSKMRQGIVQGYCLSIIGKPNVGKSSVLNAILLDERAIVSPIAGTTRDTIEENIHINGDIIKLIDTAGIRETQDIVESLGIQKSLSAIEQSDIILAIFDASRVLENEDRKIIELLNTQEKKHCIIALNKNDLPQKLQLNEIETLLNISYQSVSITTKDTQDCLLKLKHLLSLILNQEDLNNEILLTSSFQIMAVQKTLDHIQNAIKVFNTFELELFSYHIKDAVQSISNITQPYDISEMFDKMFGDFCLGK
ncbi:tRNA uridine-5-carboxymethylaminomethyl(34) synthesis GTPase MnmE [Helicobacter sp. 13S00477-4]|uniref:tRNA uridine-5-carboxymethylaminomethyl(34) synthesis GTPase MnmE n=1 Tax=Helicobacter sp. 13S00477-4 TaxID=1905759 RepID=UPI000BA6F3B4|nr:tRNA uridine-5-carboxymethylaminomethyl(34) synthesis GTPase MnmE [Helicobacter sp. 13S00477-4]PAF52552.1 tRNA uridine-5-carboxymethylaminomethyl(34) synthesis GTPase MnmE [Helicobacter sp. 13S00477-4]